MDKTSALRNVPARSGAASDLERTVAWLRAIGLQLEEVAGTSGFLKAVRIHKGGLHYDPDRAHVADILHEAGHLAIIPVCFRPLASDDISKVQSLMIAEMVALFAEDTTVIDSPLCRAVMQSGDPEATAWAFAAGRAIGLDDKSIIKDGDYDGESASVRLGLLMGTYVGINGLVAGGMCAGTRLYPAMIRWLQE
ncbi:hypothetical protein [Sphingobium sp. AP50]|uniref:hypothetical protein n=1 Tax=Sphingobium sp. AP50 TaxID=1884369 RepID=UPI0011607006|nr:hypothetical protein [Sphingobium sp. AP50]